MLGLPVLHSWLLAVFRIRCKLLGTACSSFQPLAPYFLPFLLSLFKWGWPQKRLFPCAAAQAHQSFIDFSRWPDMLPRLSLFPLVTGYHHFARDWTHGGVHAMQALYQGATFVPAANFPLALSSPLVDVIIAHLSVTWQWALSNYLLNNWVGIYQGLWKAGDKWFGVSIRLRGRNERQKFKSSLDYNLRPAWAVRPWLEKKKVQPQFSFGWIIFATGLLI